MMGWIRLWINGILIHLDTLWVDFEVKAAYQSVRWSLDLTTVEMTDRG